MSDYRTLENKIRDIVARPWTKDPKKVHHKLQQIQKKIIDEEPEMLNNKAIGIPDSVIEAAKQINKGKTEVDVNPQYKTDVKDSEDDDDDKKVKKEELKGKQHKIDKNKNGKIDSHDFKLLRKEDVELDEADSYSIRNTESDTDKIYHISKYPITANHTIYKKIKAKDPKAQIHKNGQPIKEEAEQVEEGGMPASVIKSKQNRANMSDKQFADSHKDKSDADLRSMAWRHGLGKPGTPGHDHYVNKRNKGLKEEVSISDEEQVKLDAIAATFAEDAVQSAQKTSQQKMKAASITAKATVQADKIKDQARKQAQNNSYQPEGDMVEEGNLAAQIRDAKPSITGHIEVSVGDKKVKIPHKKAQDFLGSYHSKRTPNEKDEHEKAFRKEIGG